MMFFSLFRLYMRKNALYNRFLIARVAELVDALVLGTSILGCESSSLSFRTIIFHVYVICA